MITVLHGDNRETLKQQPEKSCQCIVTSPPYWSQRSYLRADHPNKHRELGMEESPFAFIENIVAVFAECWRVLADDGVLWLNMGDNYAGSWKAQGQQGENGQMAGRNIIAARAIARGARKLSKTGSLAALEGLKDKDMIGMPWRIAFALQEAGWYLRMDNIWNKPNAHPESVADRPTKSHEYLFLLSKMERYYYNAEAIKEPSTGNSHPRGKGDNPKARANAEGSKQNSSFSAAISGGLVEMRNKRSVWNIPTEGYEGAHFAAFPPALVRPCILAGSKPGDTILDPFGGSGTVGQVALELGRKAVLCELNDDYLPLIDERTTTTIGFQL